MPCPARGPTASARVAICVTTYRRPRLLEGLLRSLVALRFEKCALPQICVVVVDNDAAQEARGVVEGVSASLPWPVRYAVESRGGLSHARNTAVRVALAEQSDFVAFVDDDEVVTPLWLDEMLSVHARFAADAVCGPVLPSYDAGVPSWVVKGRLLEPQRYETGRQLAFGMTGNTLISAGCFNGDPQPFHPAFGRSGAEDTHLFMRLAHSGRRLVWADEAIVREVVPAARARVGWMVKRAFRVGNCYVFCERDLMPVDQWVLRRLLSAVARLLGGTVFLIPSILLGRSAVVRALRVVAHGLGSLTALMGIRYQQYRAG